MVLILIRHLNFTTESNPFLFTYWVKCNIRFKYSSNVTFSYFHRITVNNSGLGIKKFDNPISRSSKIVPQEVQKSNSKYNNNSYTDMSYINQSYQSNNPERCDGFDETAMLMSLVKSYIEYDSIMQNAQWKDWELYEELYEIICEVVCVKRKNVRIGGEDYPYELVKSKFMKLNSSHLLYVIECM